MQRSIAAPRGGPQLAAMSDRPPAAPADTTDKALPPAAPAVPPLPKEIGGAPGPEPTRYGDWDHKGRCTDF